MGRSAGFLLAALIVLIGGCDSSRAPQPRLVVLYTTCSVSRAFLSPYTPSVPYTPQLSRFKNEAVTFTSHHTEAGQSGIAFASLFSGTQAPVHSIYAHPKALPDDITLITEAFAEGGYDVFSWLDHRMASARLGYAQGVPRAHRGNGILRARSNARFQAILERLESDPDYKAFVILNFSVTHGPYGLVALSKNKSRALPEFYCSQYPAECEVRSLNPEAFARNRSTYYRFERRLQGDFEETVRTLELSEEQVAVLGDTIELLYKTGIHRLDQLFGELLDEIRARGLFDASVIAFTSDHGEIMRRDGAFFYWTHGYQQAPEVIGVPLLIRAPGATPREYRGVTRSIDVLPTLAGLSGVPIPDTVGIGEDLSGVLRSGAQRDDLLAFSHSSVLPHVVVEDGELPGMKNFGSFFPRRDPNLIWVSVRSGNDFYKLRRLSDAGFEPAVYDLQADPNESINLFDPDDPEQARMFARLEEYRQRLIAGYASSEARDEVVPEDEQAEMLRSLGYIE